jgi:hypothetical protein
MTDTVKLSIPDACKTVLVTDSQAGPVVRSAVSLLQEAWSAGTGVMPATANSRPLAASPAIVLRTGGDGGEEAFRLDWDKTARTLTVVGGGSRGVLYGVDEVLDRLRWSDEALTIDLEGYKSKPDAVSRAIGMPDLAYSPREIARVLKELARLRYNQVSVRRVSLTYETMPELGLSVEPGVETQRERITRLIEEAARWGMGVSTGIRLIDFPPEFLQVYPDAAGQGASLCPLAPDTLLLVRRQMEELVQAYPGLSGLRVLGSEAQSDVFACHCPRCRDKSPSERFGVLLREMADVLGDRHIYLMTYLSGWRNIKEPEYYRDLADHLPATATIQVNAMWSDQFITHPPHPLIGAYPGDRTLIDFDLWGEYWGWGEIPCCLASYLSERMNYCYDRGVTRYWGRVSWAFIDDLYNGTLNEVNYVLLARLLWDRRADVGQVVRSWAARRFGQDAAEGIVDLMSLTWEIVRHMMYADDMLINSHSHPPESLTRFRYLMRDFSAAFFEDGAERSRITPENIARWLAEKQQAIQECERAVEILAELEPCLAPEQHRELYATFYDVLQTAHVWYHLCDAVWKYELMCREESELIRPGMRAQIVDAIDRCERQVWHAKRCDPGYAFGITNELRIALKQPVPPWGGFVPTGRSEERAAGGAGDAGSRV